MKQPTAVLDIGSSKVVCLIGECKRDGQVALYGTGICEHRGLRKRAFVEDTSLRAAIHNAIEQAQIEAKRRIRGVYVGTPGQMVEVVCKTAGVGIENGDHRVSEDDIKRLVEKSLDFFHPDSHELIHSMPVRFKVDEARCNAVPVGMPAEKVAGQISHVFMLSDFRKVIDSALEEIGVEASMYIHAQLAEGLFVIEKSHRGRLAVLVDVGYYNTDVDVFRNEAVVFHATLDVGGAHFASDLTLGLNIMPDAAESIKRRHVFGLDYEGSVLESIRTTSGQPESIEYEQIQYILDARAEETSYLIKEILLDCGPKIPSGTQVYLCGGGFAMMRGARELLQGVLDYPVKVQTQWMPKLNSPNYTSAFGVLNYIYNSVSETGDRIVGRENYFLDKLINFFIK